MAYIITIGIIVAELIAPAYVSVFIAIANIFVPDAVPCIDEIVGAVIAVKKLAG